MLVVHTDTLIVLTVGQASLAVGKAAVAIVRLPGHQAGNGIHKACVITGGNAVVLKGG